MPAVPMRRDTWLIAPNGYTVIRFVADNPGVWVSPRNRSHSHALALLKFNGHNAPSNTLRAFAATKANTSSFSQFLHCHMDWHVEIGLAMTLIEAPQQLQQQQSINPAMASLCKAQGIPTTGNAGGNTQNWFDLSNANTVAPAARG